MGFETNIKYTLGTSDATVCTSIPWERMMIKLMEAGIICLNYDQAALKFGNDRAIITGKIGCRTTDGHPGKREDT